jgi:hypothetical protein
MQVTLEEECCAALQTVIAQGHKALVLHSRQRDAYKVIRFPRRLA